MIILDTDHISFLFGHSGEITRRITDRLELVHSQQIVTTIVSFEEQVRGRLAIIAEARTPSQLSESYNRLSRLIHEYRRIPVLEFDQGAVDVFFDLKRAKIRVGTMDLRIAAIAIANDATLLSRNLTDFGKIPGLKVEDWCV